MAVISTAHTSKQSMKFRFWKKSVKLLNKKIIPIPKRTNNSNDQKVIHGNSSMFIYLKYVQYMEATALPEPRGDSKRSKFLLT
jgi:hypothetical protein